jgi:2-keto-4-pentenoate hydratase/2-oxohepta-3-ene-1,7-dioic acid hydratase in catechol pathway
MRIATVGGRPTVVVPGGGIDVARSSGGALPSSPAHLYERWDEFRAWAVGIDGRPADPQVPDFRNEPSLLGPPSPAPRQVFAIAFNYREHATEGNVAVPESPTTFTKYLGSLTGPDTVLALPSDTVDWEAELVVVIGRPAHHVLPGDAWSHVAGLTAGQDFTDRAVAAAGPMPQFSLGKSFPGFGPTGPWLVTPDEFPDPDDLALECRLNGELVQESRTSLLVFSVSVLISHLSEICPLFPGDLIFTGTPSGVGWGRDPRRTLRPGDEIVTRIEGIGALRQRCG